MVAFVVAFGFVKGSMNFVAGRLARALVGIPPKLRAPRPAPRECVWVDELN